MIGWWESQVVEESFGAKQIQAVAGQGRNTHQRARKFGAGRSQQRARLNAFNSEKTFAHQER